jgi:dolichol-phosphate mannosyltransferase
MPSLSAVVPTYNEAENAALLVQRVTTALAGIDFELIVVDDSTDGTDRVFQSLARAEPRLRVVHRTGHRGLATAVTAGIALAKGDVVCVLDADLQHPPEELPALREALEQTGADLAIASRYVPGGGYELTVGRRIISRVATILAWTLLGRARSVSDPLSGFFAFRRAVVDGVLLRPIGFKILLEILVRGHISRVVEVPYRFEARGGGQSKLTLAQHLDYLRHLLALSAVRAPSVQRVTRPARHGVAPQ